MLPEKSFVVTVNEKDEETGTMEKMEAHQKGILHRAFSIFILNRKGELLLQQRAEHKYHSGSLWTNTCCSHPMPGEGTTDAAVRRLREEMGIVTELQPMFSFLYKAEVGNGLVEHELDHVFCGVYDGECAPDPEEVMNHRYMALPELEKWIDETPQNFTTWMRIVFPRFCDELAKRKLV
jgi:isopentenyl-diphosphate delta-isomerase